MTWTTCRRDQMSDWSAAAAAKPREQRASRAHVSASTLGVGQRLDHGVLAFMCFLRLASVRGVAPFASRNLISAPALSRRETIFAWPSMAHSMRGVLPCLSGMSTFAPLLRTNSISTSRSVSSALKQKPAHEGASQEEQVCRRVSKGSMQGW